MEKDTLIMELEVIHIDVLYGIHIYFHQLKENYTEIGFYM